MAAAYQKPPERGSVESTADLSVAETRKRFDRYSMAVRDLSMELTNRVRLVQSSVSGLQGVPEDRVWAQVQAAHVTLHMLEAALGMEQPEKP